MKNKLYNKKSISKINVILNFVSLFLLISCNDNLIKKNENIFNTNEKNISKILNDTFPNELVINESELNKIDYKTDSFNFKDYIYNKASPLFLINDIVYKNVVNQIQLYSGIVRIKSDILVVDSAMNQSKPNKTIGLFKIKNGLFIGNQVFLTTYLGMPMYIRTRIEPNLNMFVGIDIIEVLKDQKSDFSYTDYDYKTGESTKKYYKIKYKNIEDFETTFYYTNGQKSINCNFQFDQVEYALDKFQTMLTRKSDPTLKIIKNKIEIFIENGSNVYTGDLKENGTLSFGETYDENGNKISYNEFKQKFQVFNGSFNLDDASYKNFRKYFNIFEENKSMEWD